MKVMRSISWVIYYLFARHLPSNYAPYSLGSKKIRAFFCKRLFKRFGKNVDIGPNVEFFNVGSSEIGNNSGIGANSLIGTTAVQNNSKSRSRTR